ncbi:hypothetical protein V2S66_04700 [Streptomyces sp. V4-01]|uniref:Uncharacterized protein n=1 Tax=Actinacidiphila polyblastidii TaxID=3110430 RepID=A0ABU7P7F0_9ACTN|nr:hypothetical protein [Streptomyces sp. V4-01]
MAPRTARTGPAAGTGPGAEAADRHWLGGARCAAGCALGFWSLTTLLDLAAGSLTPGRAGLWCALAAALFAVLLPPRVTAGRGRMAARGLLRVERVRTDALVAVRRQGGATSQTLVLQDVHGGRLHLDPRLLSEAPLLWHELDRGARISRAHGTLRCGQEVLRELETTIDRDLAHEVFRASGLD